MGISTFFFAASDLVWHYIVFEINTLAKGCFMMWIWYDYFISIKHRNKVFWNVMKIVVLSIFLLALSFEPAAVNAAQTTTCSYERQQKEYKKIEDVEVPADILKAASAKYSGYALTEAYMAEDGEYKLILSKDSKPVAAYFKATGEFIKEEVIR